MGSLVSYRRDGAVATIAMDDGKRNALSVAMLGELDAAFDRAATDGAIVVLTGREGVFSAGFDLKVLAAGGPDALTMLSGGLALAEKMLTFPTPVVVASTGHAIAMAVFLLLSGDFRIGASGPFKVSANEVAIGMTMPRAAVEMCRQRLLPAHFHRAVALAEAYTPEGAVEAGFLDRVVDVADLQQTALTVAGELAKLNMKAHAATKLRVRGPMLAAIRAAVEADNADFRALNPGA